MKKLPLNTLVRALIAAALAFLVAGAASAQRVSGDRNMQKEALIWQELESISPTSLAAFKQGTEAMDKENYQEAAVQYAMVLKKVPQWDVINRRQGLSLVLAGRPIEGLPLLRKAVALKRSPENLISLATHLSSPSLNVQGSDSDMRQAFTLAEEAWKKNTDQTDSSYSVIYGRLAIFLNNEAGFREATAALAEHQPDLLITHYFKAVRADMDEDWWTAEQEIKKAGELGMPAADVESFLASGVHSHVVAWRYAYLAIGAVIVWAVGLGLLFLSGEALSAHTLRFLETGDPNALTTPQETRLRRIYRTIINTAGIYYYVSLPVVIFLIIAVSGGITYAFFMLGHIPIKLVALLVIGAIITIYKMIRSLFTPRIDEDPGRKLQAEEAPGLWALSRQVADTIGTKAIDEIRVTPGTEFMVYERGRFRDRAQDKAERVLVVGAGVLNDFGQNAFRAVLAHEYGHFIHRDTAGGDIAFRVNSDMIIFARSMVTSGQNTHWNLGFQFLRLYHKIFTRISHGATRLQEVLADRRASFHYGAKAFEEGLSHVIRRDIMFKQMAHNEISAAFTSNRTLQNLYEIAPPDNPDQAKTIETEFEKTINRETSMYDTHPSPVERFRLVNRVVSQEEPAATGMVWELFTDREALTREMSSLVEKRMNRAG